jgi:copper oxidase (laccase) domain-containing protein
VGPEVRETFHVAGFAEKDLDHWFLPAESPTATHVLDMWRANRDQLIAAGVDPANVHVADSARRPTMTGSGRTAAKARRPAGCWR